MATNREQEQQLDPSTTSAAYDYMYPKWCMIGTLLGGTAAMREAGEDFLPKHPAEDQDKYNVRLSQTTLYNVTELTLKSLVGRVFREAMILNDDVPQQIKDLSEDIDSQKTNMSAFCQNWFKEAMAKGYAHVLVDMPALSDADRAVRTLADDAAENRRPFWSLIKPENLIFAFSQEVGGVDTLMHIRIVEFEKDMVGFVETCRTRIRILEPGTWEVWENKNEGKKGRKPQWEAVESGISDLPVIPLVTFYADREGFMLSKPPLEDLAYLNIRHWQSTSDQINVLTVARFPMLAASGAVQEAGRDTMKIGPRQLLSMREPNGKFYYVEHTGKAITAGKDDLEKLEDMMAAYGAEFLRRQVAGRTAFERAADESEAISPLKDMALRFQDAVKAALSFTAQWMKLDGEKSGGTVTVNTDYTEEEVTTAPLTTLALARTRGDISRKTWLEEMKRYGILDSELDVDEEIDEIRTEMEEGPHPPTFFTGQEQIQGKSPDATTMDGVTAGGDGFNSADPKVAVKPRAKKKAPANK